jgi:hypothetical protein
MIIEFWKTGENQLPVTKVLKPQVLTQRIKENDS